MPGRAAMNPCRASATPGRAAMNPCRAAVCRNTSTPVRPAISPGGRSTSRAARTVNGTSSSRHPATPGRSRCASSSRPMPAVPLYTLASCAIDRLAGAASTRRVWSSRSASRLSRISAASAGSTRGGAGSARRRVTTPGAVVSTRDGSVSTVDESMSTVDGSASTVDGLSPVPASRTAACQARAGSPPIRSAMAPGTPSGRSPYRSRRVCNARRAGRSRSSPRVTGCSPCAANSRVMPSAYRSSVSRGGSCRRCRAGAYPGVPPGTCRPS